MDTTVNEVIIDSAEFLVEMNAFLNKFKMHQASGIYSENDIKMMFMYHKLSKKLEKLNKGLDNLRSLTLE